MDSRLILRHRLLAAISHGATQGERSSAALEMLRSNLQGSCVRSKEHEDRSVKRGRSPFWQGLGTFQTTITETLSSEDRKQQTEG